MREYFYYPGCTSPVRLPSYEAATIAVLKELDVKLTYMHNANCCGAQYVESLNPKAFVAMSGRILALAEKFGKDICVTCGACNHSLKHAKHELDTNEKLRKEVNGILKEEDLEYTGSIKVVHLLQILNNDVGINKIRQAVVRPFDSSLVLTTHYGCHLTRPWEIAQVDDPENPMIMDHMIEALGATVVQYPEKTRCCGGPLLAMDPDAATRIGLRKIEDVRSVGGQGIVTACGFCDIQLTQVQFGGDMKPEDRIPIIQLPQLMGLAFGIDEETLGLDLNKISPDPIINALLEVVC